MRVTLLLTTLALATAAHAQWQIQDAHTTASLRGIHSVGNGIAWASGTEGTVLRTEDNGRTWHHCATPPNAEKLDFRGIQAFDWKTAIVMSSGPGNLSRLYKTTDGCRTWELLRTNTEKDGFWDALAFKDDDAGELIGDPVAGRFVVISYRTNQWTEEHGDPFAPSAHKEEAAFAASNSSVLSFGHRDFMLGTGGPSGSRVVFFHKAPAQPGSDLMVMAQDSRDVPITSHSQSSGIFSLGMRDRQNIVAVGGDYLKPNDATGIAAFTNDGGQHWTASTAQPHGYRSSVAWDATTGIWITTGPNGTDISTDDGRNWHPLTPASSDAPDADKNWNALSLPFVVGPHGRIGILRGDALPPHK
jgi:photosystem II stability/assembly factor-like uncharacterized protein